MTALESEVSTRRYQKHFSWNNLEHYNICKRCRGHSFHLFHPHMNQIEVAAHTQVAQQSEFTVLQALIRPLISSKEILFVFICVYIMAKCSILWIKRLKVLCHAAGPIVIPLLRSCSIFRDLGDRAAEVWRIVKEGGPLPILVGGLKYLINIYNWVCYVFYIHVLHSSVLDYIYMYMIVYV